MLVGSVADGVNSSCGFYADSRIVVTHQSISGISFSFSASESINILRNTPSILSKLQETVRAIRAVLDRIDALTIPSHAASPIIHI
jgi:serine palmitoyltransferase